MGKYAYAERPQGEGIMTRIEYRSASDDLGRCHFGLYWMADYHPGDPAGEHRTAERCQEFKADPRRYGHPRPEEVPR